MIKANGTKKPVTAAAKTPAVKAPASKATASKPVAKKTTAKPAAKSVAPKDTAPVVASPAKPAKVAAKSKPAKPAAKAPSKSTTKPPKPAAKQTAKTVTKPATAKPTAETKQKKPKLVRDSFTMPHAEYQVLINMKKLALKAGVEVKKSELLRVGVALIQKLDVTKVREILATLPSLKAGRPKNEK